jgi:predicted component of type VI protein secretion system
MLPLVIQIERTEERVADTCAFAKSPVRIGRNPLSDLQLDESFVSQWHGVIRFEDERTTYLDLGSTNPTLVDGQAIVRNVEVEVTETTDLRIGSLRLHLLRVAAPPELFGARRKTSFARAGVETGSGSVAATMYLGARKAALGALPKLPASNPILQSNVAAPFAAQSASAADLARPGSRPSSPNVSAAGKDDLQSLYTEYRGVRERFLSKMRARLEAETGRAREDVFDRLVQEFPEIAHEPELRKWIGKLGIESWRTGVPDMADWLARLTDGLFPPPGMGGEINLALAMERMGEVLEVFSTAFIELRVAYEQFADEMALDKPSDDSILQTSKNPRAVLAYLLNPGPEGISKVTELSRAMADFAVHQVALVSAVVEGARDVLNELSPNALAGHGERQGASFFAKLLGGDQKALWTRYISKFDETLDEDRFTRKLFGRGFARKYYAITGGRRSIPPPPSRRQPMP